MEDVYQFYNFLSLISCNPLANWSSRRHRRFLTFFSSAARSKSFSGVFVDFEFIKR
ncbi:hypothetical protein AHAS_Ahas15G0198400 [Arachis hypogaea]